MHWQLRTRTMPLDGLPRLMGIINVTPDSFSDGGRFFETERAIEQGLRLAAEGADVLDVGGESTRPYATPVPEDEERRRVVAVVAALCRQVAVPVSIDTSKAAVARAAIDAGAEIINDVTGLAGDPEMLPVAATSGAGVCVMHMQGTPETMQDNPQYGDVVADVMRYLAERRDALVSAGIARERICLDPGIGFGKKYEHNLDLLRATARFHELGCPVLVGHSRKGFLGRMQGDPDADRLPGTIGVALAVARQGVHILRVHDVAAVRHALTAFHAAGPLRVP